MQGQAKFYLWDKTGRLLFSEKLIGSSLVLSADADADCRIPELGDLCMIVRAGTSATEVHHWIKGRGKESSVLVAAKVLVVGDFRCMMLMENETRKDAERSPGETDELRSMLHQMVDWLAAPTKDARDLPAKLEEFLRLVVRASHASSGIILLAEQAGLKIVNTYGCDLKDAESLWRQMPDDVEAQVLRDQVQMILPRALQSRTDAQTTMYVSGVRSSVGFPIKVEGEIFGFYYLNFQNVVRDFTEDLQTALVEAAVFLGLVIQRAYFRDHISSLQARRTLPADAAPLVGDRLMVGESEAIQRIYLLIQKLAPTNVSVLVHGETGTGKELVARELHRLSHRHQKAFVAVNAAAIPESLLESELFGHQKGAFTGAVADRMGLIEKASGGTLFVDEIGDLPLSLQAKLLRVLQEKEITPLGSNKVKAVDFRLIAATHCDLQEKIKNKLFREDLYYRLAGVVVHLPSLRERRVDILLIANFLKRNFAARNRIAEKDWSADAVKALKNHSWPGNVRELDHVVSRALVMSEGRMIGAEDLGLLQQRTGASSHSEDESGSLDEAKNLWLKGYIEEALVKHAGSRAQTAKALKIGERTLFRYIEHLGIH